MYAVSSAFETAIKGRSRQVAWYGHIAMKDGTACDFDGSQVVEGTGVLSKSCSSSTSIDLGGVYASELTVQLRLDIDRYKLTDAQITLYVRFDYQDNVRTLEEASKYSWGDMASCSWGDSVKKPYYDIPMGIFTVSETLRAANSIKITAYDNMLEFDKKLPDMDTTARTPFEWLRWICDGCGVTLGITNNELRELPNGSRNLTFADVSDNVSTYRDLLSELATVLASVALIDREGKLTFGQYKKDVNAEVGADFRYSSDFSDYQSYYTGMYATYRAKSMQEYYRNVGTLDDTGLVIDIGCNVFLQISNDTNRSTAVQDILDSLKDLLYTPFHVTMPLNPAFDLMDVLTFSGNQATEEDIAPITAITYKINDKMTVQCSGENPKLMAAQSKESKVIAGLNDGGSLSGSSYVSSDFWILIDSFPDEETEMTDEGVTTEVTVNTTVDNTRLQILWTGCYTLDEDAEVCATVYINEAPIYSITDAQTAGTHVLNVSTGYDIKGRGEYIVQISVKEVVKE